VSTKDPLPTDKHVGSRMRMRRLMLGMSQDRLAEQLDITFQQVQKYEKGTNRVSASRLQQIAQILDVPISFFFEGAPDPTRQRGSSKEFSYISQFAADPDGLTLAKAFMQINDKVLRRTLVRLVEGISRQEQRRAT
jgi:transcriptional regulator with XRE-family HTH domain